jgi:hypothetical protein
MDRMDLLLNYNTLGHTIIGHVRDTDKKTLERQLQDYDKQLYIKWNPKKRQGLGVWEIRRKPDEKSKVFKTEWNGYKIFELEYAEIDLVHQVLDVPFLSYEVLGKIRSMDAWNDKNFVANLDYKGAVHKAETDRKAREELTYEIKQHKKEWRDFATFIAEGNNLGHVLNKFRPK